MIMDGLSAPEVSARLDVNTGLPYRWKREHLAELDATGPAKASPTAMAAEIDPLRKQLAKEKRINEILKKRSAPAPRKTKPLRVHATPTNQV